MPRTTREYMIRYCEQGLNNIERALESIAKMLELYGDGYAEYKEPLYAVMASLAVTLEVLQQFREDKV